MVDPGPFSLSEIRNKKGRGGLGGVSHPRRVLTPTQTHKGSVDAKHSKGRLSHPPDHVLGHAGPRAICPSAKFGTKRGAAASASSPTPAESSPQRNQVTDPSTPNTPRVAFLTHPTTC